MNLVGAELRYHFTYNGPIIPYPLPSLEIRGPAVSNAIAPIIFSLGSCMLGIRSLPQDPPSCNWEGIVTISDSQVTEVLAGLWYAQLQTGYPWLTRAPILPVDSDGDGVPDYRDHCPNSPASAVVNPEGCSIERLCPCDGPWNNHGEYMDCLLDVSAAFLKDRIISESDRRVLVKQAATSDCGKAK